MIRPCSTKDKTSIAVYLASKLGISLSEATIKAKNIVKSGLPNFIKEEKNLTGLCYVEIRTINDKKEKFVEILSDNWRLAESFIQCLRWKLDGIFWFSLPKHDSLNRTYNKNSIRFVRVDGDKNIYNYKFEKREFRNYKSEDLES
jgi:hypothetical protein